MWMCKSNNSASNGTRFGRSKRCRVDTTRACHKAYAPFIHTHTTPTSQGRNSERTESHAGTNKGSFRSSPRPYTFWATRQTPTGPRRKARVDSSPRGSSTFKRVTAAAAKHLLFRGHGNPFLLSLSFPLCCCGLAPRPSGRARRPNTRKTRCLDEVGFSKQEERNSPLAQGSMKHSASPRGRHTPSGDCKCTLVCVCPRWVLLGVGGPRARQLRALPGPPPPLSPNRCPQLPSKDLQKSTCGGGGGGRLLCSQGRLDLRVGTLGVQDCLQTHFALVVGMSPSALSTFFSPSPPGPCVNRRVRPPPAPCGFVIPSCYRLPIGLHSNVAS